MLSSVIDKLLIFRAGQNPDIVQEIELVKSLITNKTHGDRENVTNLWFLITDQTPDDYRNQSLTTLIDEIKNLSNAHFILL